MKMKQLYRFHNRIVSAVFALWLLTCFSVTTTAQTYLLTKTRLPQLHVKDYKQIAIGDIVGPLGLETERSLDLRDAVTSKLFNSDGYEVLDRNTLSQLLLAQKKGKVTIIDEKTISALSKQLKSALLITGRMQTEKVEQKLYTVKDYTCPNNLSYYWMVTGEASVQIKIIDVNTGRMIYSAPVTNPISVRSTETCQETAKFDIKPIVTKAFDDLSAEVVKLLIPYADQIQISFQCPVITLFKKLNQVVAFYQIGDFQKGTQILQEYAQDNSLKDNLKSKAHYNYALGLFCTGEYEHAKAELKAAMSINPYDITYQQWYDKADKEKSLQDKIAVNK